MLLLNSILVEAHESYIHDILRSYTTYPENLFKSHMWLCESPQKRAIYDIMYGRYLREKTNHKILDVGGGYSALTSILIENTARYSLIEPFHHDCCRNIPELNGFVVSNDWFAHSPQEYDVVFANALFPNVDQRLELFIKKYIKVSHKIVLSLTFFDRPTVYLVKRENSDERMYILAYTGRQIETILHKFEANIINKDFSVLYPVTRSIFNNGRYVCIVEIEGDI